MKNSAIAIPATTPFGRPPWFTTVVGVELQCVALADMPGLRPTVYHEGVTLTLVAIWIWNGSLELMVLLEMRSTASWAVTFVDGSIFARLVRLEMWNVTNMWVPFPWMTYKYESELSADEEVCGKRGGGGEVSG